MKLLVFSDSHQHTDYMFYALSRVGRHMDGVLHLGDGFGDLKPVKTEYPGLFFYEVAGNCDFAQDEPSFKVIETAGKRILMTHGHSYGVRSGCERLARLAAEKEADICFFGHTHTPVVIRNGGLTMMNPGSIANPRSGGYPSYGVVEITDDGRVYASVVEMGPGYFT